MIKITEKECSARLRLAYQKFGTSYKRLDRYEHSHKPMRFVCVSHGAFSKSLGDVLNGSGCPECSQLKKNQARIRRTDDSFKKTLREIFPSIRYLSSDNRAGKQKFLCTSCNYPFSVLRATALKLGCPACSGLWKSAPPKTGPHIKEEEFRKQLEKTPYRLLSPFQGKSKKHKFRCIKHNTVFVSKGALKRKACPQCGIRAKRPEGLLTKEVWDLRIQKTHGKAVRLLGEYYGLTGNRKYRFKCYTCFNTWKAQLPGVANGHGCPHCARQNKVKGFKVKEFTLQGQTLKLQGYEYQAVLWILENSRVQLKDIEFESAGKVPVIQYKFGRRWRRYYPDMFLPKTNRIIEVKSAYTAGLDGRGTGRQFRQVQAKARACLEEGYSYSLLLMSGNGTRFPLPPNWYLMNRTEVLGWCAYQRGDLVPGEAKKPVPLENPYKGDKSRPPRKRRSRSGFKKLNRIRRKQNGTA